MNRLWVRLSLAFSGVVLTVILTLGASVHLTGGRPSELDNWTSYDLTDAEIEAIEFLETREVYGRIAEQQSRQAVPIAVIYVAAITAVAAIVAGAIMSRHLTRPLESLQLGAQAISDNQLDHRVKVTGSTEMRQVAQTFNQMADELETAETLRQNLLADVAHELRHPLHILKGNLRAILDDVYPLNKEEIARLVDQTNHMTALINDLHELAQAEARQLPMYKQEVDIAQLVKEITAVFKPAALAKQIDLQVELLGTMPMLNVDPSRIRQVLHNLLDNGLRHTGINGRVHLTVEQAENGLQIRIADSGTGIRADELPHVFDRFYRADNARSRGQDGAGLGLAIARAIVEAHDGHISATSAGAGLGSTFIVWLPILR